MCADSWGVWLGPGSPWLARFGFDWLDLAAATALAGSNRAPCEPQLAPAASFWLLWMLQGSILEAETAAFSCIFVACMHVMAHACGVVKTLQKLIRNAHRCSRTTSKKCQKIVSRGIRNGFCVTSEPETAVLASKTANLAPDIANLAPQTTCLAPKTANLATKMTPLGSQNDQLGAQDGRLDTPNGQLDAQDDHLGAQVGKLRPHGGQLGAPDKRFCALAASIGPPTKAPTHSVSMFKQLDSPCVASFSCQ